MTQTITREDVFILGRTVYAEGRGEPYEGQKAIVHTIVNRRDLRVGDADHSLAATALRWRQFSGWNEDDPNRELAERVEVDDPVFRECLRATLEALDEADFTDGARHYMTRTRRARGWPHTWGPVREPCFDIGAHLFYNDVA